MAKNKMRKKCSHGHARLHSERFIFGRYHTALHMSQPFDLLRARRGRGIFCTSIASCCPGGRCCIKFGRSIKQSSPTANPILPPILHCMLCCQSLNIPTLSPAVFVTSTCARPISLGVPVCAWARTHLLGPPTTRTHTHTHHTHWTVETTAVTRTHTQLR